MNRNPVKAIKEKCLDCCCGQKKEVEECPMNECALYPFRLGKNPYRAPRKPREITAEQKAAMIEALKRGRETQLRKKEIDDG